MAQLQIVYPLRSGTQERWRRLAQELAGSRREQCETCCQQVGITQVQIWVVQISRSELLLMTLHAQELQQALAELASSESPFDRFFFSSRRRHTRWTGDWSSDVCSSD